MRVLTNVLALCAVVGLSSFGAPAQKTKLPFQSGEWKVNLTMVLNNGKPMNLKTAVTRTKGHIFGGSFGVDLG